MELTQLDSQDWQQLVERLGGSEALARSARAHKAFLRPRGVKKAEDVLRLALMYGPGGGSLRSLAAAAAQLGLADMSDVAVMERIRTAADWLQSLCAERLARTAGEIGAAMAGQPIRIVDSSRLKGPGARAWRLHLCFDAELTRMVDAAITTTKEGERLDRLTVVPGEIRLGDRGLPQPDGIRKVLAQGAEVLVRLTWNSLQLRAAGKPIDWLALFKEADERGMLDMPVCVHKAHSSFTPLAMRLVVVKKPPEAAVTARKKAQRASRKNQRRTDPRTLAGANHIVLLTSLSPEAFPAASLAALYRVRWQIELAFRRMKSILHIDRMPARDPDLARAWLHAHLLFALLIDEIAAEQAISPSAASAPICHLMAPNRFAGQRSARRHLAAA
jgi:IS4 transposase